MTDKPLVARCEPTVLTLEPGIYWWCACGRSKTQPFCDGTHDITDIKPVKLRLRETSEVALCNCKYTAKKPYCDGTHERMTPEPAEVAAAPVEPASGGAPAAAAPEAAAGTPAADTP